MIIFITRLDNVGRGRNFSFRLSRSMHTAKKRSVVIAATVLMQPMTDLTYTFVGRKLFLEYGNCTDAHRNRQPDNNRQLQQLL